MNNLLVLMGNVILSLSATALAQEAASTKSQLSTEQPPQSPSIEYVFRASHLLGKELQDSQGEAIGEVEDLIITKDDRVVRVIVSVGGLFSLGQKRVAVGYEDLQVDPHKEVVVYKSTQETLERQPEFYYREERKIEKAIRKFD